MTPASALKRSKVRALESLSDHELTKELASGREEALEELMFRYEPGISRVVERYVGQGPDAEEIVQDTFIRMTQHASRYNPKFKLSTWLYIIARNLCSNLCKKRKRSIVTCFSDLSVRQFQRLNKKEGEEKNRLPQDLRDPNQDEKEDIHRLFQLNEFETELSGALEKLPPSQKEAFLLYEHRNKSYSQISIITHVNLGTVKSRLFRARRGMASRPNPDDIK